MPCLASAVRTKGFGGPYVPHPCFRKSPSSKINTLLQRSGLVICLRCRLVLLITLPQRSGVVFCWRRHLVTQVTSWRRSGMVIYFTVTSNFRITGLYPAQRLGSIRKCHHLHSLFTTSWWLNSNKYLCSTRINVDNANYITILISTNSDPVEKNRNIEYINIFRYWIDESFILNAYTDQITTILSINTFEVKFMCFTYSSQQTALKVSTRTEHKGLGEAEVESIVKTVTANQNPIQTNVNAI